MDRVASDRKLLLGLPRIRSVPRSYLAELRERVLVFDGSMGANLQQLALTADDFGGPQFEGCLDALCLTRPEAPARLHRGFLEVGCDVVETNTFQASRLRLGEWGLADQTVTINQRGAALARSVCDEFEARDGRPRFVAGAIGPTGYLPSSDDPTLSAIGYDQLVETFAEQAGGLIDGGADLLIIETQQDILETRAAVVGSRRAARARGREVPLQVQVSLDTNGRMLLGTDISAALAILEGIGADDHRPELFDRARAHARAGSLPGSVGSDADQRHPECGYSDQPRRRQGTLSARARGAGRGARRVRRRPGCARGWRLLRHDLRAPAGRGPLGWRSHAAPAPRARGHGACRQRHARVRPAADRLRRPWSASA